MDAQVLVEGGASSHEDGLPAILAEADGYFPRFARLARTRVTVGARTTSTAALAEEVAVHMERALFEADLEDRVTIHVSAVTGSGIGKGSACDYAECWMPEQVRQVSFRINDTVLPVGVICRADGHVFLMRMEHCGRIVVAAEGTLAEVGDVVDSMSEILLDMMPNHAVN